jgi:hypothetical protein
VPVGADEAWTVIRFEDLLGDGLPARRAVVGIVAEGEGIGAGLVTLRGAKGSHPRNGSDGTMAAAAVREAPQPTEEKPDP